MPNIFAFVKDTFKLARERNVPTILSTEGLLTEESFRDILPFCDVVRIDIKGGSIQSLTDNNIWNSEFFLKRPYQVAKMGKEFGCFVEFTIPANAKQFC
jgi:pyruvate-formate lyase-activating enzyme